MATHRLPTPGRDNGTWGDILNDFLSQAHNADGSLANNVVGSSQIQDSSVTVTKLVDGTITATKLAGNIPSTKLDSATQTQLASAGTVADGSVTTAKIASGGIAPSAITGTGVITSDSRLSDQRTPLDGSVTDAKVSSSAGISKSKLAGSVQTSLTSADTAYQKPGSGIPKADFATAVQTSLSTADNSVQIVNGKTPTTGAVTLAAADVGALTQTTADGRYVAGVKQASVPSSPSTDDLWYDKANDLWKRWNGTAWVATGSATFVTQGDPILGKLLTANAGMVKVENAVPPAIGDYLTAASLTGSGTVRALWLTGDCGQLGFDARVKVWVDGEGKPSIDCDLGTLFLTHLDAHTQTGGFQASTDHIHGETQATTRWSGVLRFPIPYSNGCIIRIYNPGIAVMGRMFAEVAYEPGVAPPYRLKSLGTSYRNALSVPGASNVNLFDKSGSPGWLVWYGMACYGANGYGFLERNYALSIDGEASPSVLSSGTEDWFFASYYWMGRTFYGTPFTVVSTANNGNRTVVAGVDFLAYLGGFRFTNRVKLDLLVDLNYVSHVMSWCALFYTPVTSAWGQGTSAAAPDAPTLTSAVAYNASATVSWLPGYSDGGTPVTSCTVTASPGGATATVTGASGAAPLTTATVSGLTNGTTYTFTVTATNAVGTGAASAASSPTQAKAGAPGAPTSVAAVAGSTAASVSWTPPLANGSSAITGYTITSSPGGITASAAATATTVAVPGLTAGTAYTFTATATNASGTGPASVSSNSVTLPVIPALPTVSTGTLTADWNSDGQPYTDGQVASTVYDQSGNSRNFVPGATGPTYKASQINSSLPALRFDGSTQGMVSPDLATVAPVTIFVVARLWNGTVGHKILDTGPAARTLIGTTGASVMVANSGGTDFGSIAADGNWNLWSLQVTTGSTSKNLYKNGAVGTASTSGANAVGLVYLGQEVTGTKHPVDYARVMIYSGALSTTDRHNIEAYLSGCYGITVTQS